MSVFLFLINQSKQHIFYNLESQQWNTKSIDEKLDNDPVHNGWVELLSV